MIVPLPLQVLHVHVDLPRLRDRLRIHPQPGGRGERQPHRPEVAENIEGAQAIESYISMAGHEGGRNEEFNLGKIFPIPY